MMRAITLILVIVHLSGCEFGTPDLPGDGQWRVINYWAIWCTPCREEISELNAVDSGSDLMVLAVNYDGKDGAILREEAAEMGITFKLLEKDPGAALGIERPRVLHDPVGQSRRRSHGYAGGTPDAANFNGAMAATKALSG